MYVNVLDFGAVGDCVADDTAALQAAISTVRANDKLLFLPRGIYRVTSAEGTGSVLGRFCVGLHRPHHRPRLHAALPAAALTSLALPAPLADPPVDIP